MSDIMEFLTARLDEDEREARAEDSTCQPHVASCGYYLHEGPGMWTGCVCGYPARVLREVEAKRRLIHISGGIYDKPPKGDGWSEARARHTLRILATIYSDHPDYDPEWEQPGGVVEVRP